MEKQPVNVIFDMDTSGDCTNIGALATLHALADRGEINLLATTVGFHSPYVAACADAVNLYYGRELPVGTLHSKDEPVEYRFFADQLCREVNTRFPEGDEAEDAVRVHRRALAAAGDHSVVFAVTGLLSTPAALLASPADDLSPLTGRELIEKKITRTIVMAGLFADTYGDEPRCEYNVMLDIPAMRTVCAQWPGELIFSAFEIGIRTHSLADFIRNGDPESPVRRAYELLRAHNQGEPDLPFPSWDATVSLLAARPDAGYFDLHPYGRVAVSEEGITTWQEEAGARQSYLLPRADMPLDAVGAIITDLVMALPKNRRTGILKK